MVKLGAFHRTLPVLSLVILVGFGTLLSSTAYNVVAFSPQEFVQRPEVQDYENKVDQITAIDDWTRTQLYWSNNLRVAGIYGLAFPTFLGFNSSVINSHAVGISVAYFNAVGGGNLALAFSAELFVHGILELTGIFLITAATLRLGWNFWKGFGHVAESSLKKSGLKKMWRKILRHRRKIKLQLTDFLIIFGLGVFLIFLAAPVESYISPVALVTFFHEPVLAVAFLVAVGLFYLSLFWWGFKGMVLNLKKVWNDVGLGLRGEWKPSQAPILVFAILSLGLLLQFII